MSELDKAENFSKIDQENLIKNIQEFPLQCAKAWEEIREVVLPSYYVKANKIVILGMGGSAIGGDLIKEFIEKKCSVPVIIVRDYDLPANVNRDSLVIAVSYSGNTEETIEALRQALSKKSKPIAITTGGKLADLAAEYKFPIYKFNYDTVPRHALGFLFTSVLGILNKLALIDVKKEEIKESISLFKGLSSKISPEVPTSQNQAKKLAEELYNKIVVVMAGGYLKPVARRFKDQLNENSKQMAFWEELPEACHNFIIGLQFPNKLPDNIFVLSLSSKYEHQRVRLRENVILDILNQKKIPFEELRLEPASSILSEILSFVLLLDYTSYYLAILNKVDPRPIENINYLKKKLEETPWQR